MSPSARILGSLEAAAPKISTARYVCVTCRRQSLPYRSQIVVHRARRYNSSDSQSWRDKLRSKFWRKDTPQESTSESQRDAEEEGQEEEAEPVATPLPNYVAANTWDGLRRVGFEKKWWEKEKTRDIEFEPFLPSHELQSRDELVRALHRTMVEITMMKEVGRSMDDICKFGEEHYLALLERVQVRPSKDSSGATLIFPDDEVKDHLVQIFRPMATAPKSSEKKKGGTRATSESESAPESESKIDLSENQATPESESTPESNSKVDPSGDPEFLSLSLEAKLDFKFAFLKRASQLTGHRVPDCEITTITRPSGLLKYMLDAPKRKQKKLAEELLDAEQITSLPNVKVSAKKPGFVEQETEIGRWKVIEAELSKRGLPIEINRTPPWRRKSQDP